MNDISDLRRRTKTNQTWLTCVYAGKWKQILLPHVEKKLTRATSLSMRMLHRTDTSFTMRELRKFNFVPPSKNVQVKLSRGTKLQIQKVRLSKHLLRLKAIRCFILLPPQTVQIILVSRSAHIVSKSARKKYVNKFNGDNITKWKTEIQHYLKITRRSPYSNTNI